MRYRIKNDINLEELEKFGFQNEYEDGEEYYGKYLDDNEHKLFVYKDDGEIIQGKFALIFGFDRVELDVNNIQDLINADLVEVIKEEN